MVSLSSALRAGVKSVFLSGGSGGSLQALILPGEGERRGSYPPRHMEGSSSIQQGRGSQGWPRSGQGRHLLAWKARLPGKLKTSSLCSRSHQIGHSFLGPLGPCPPESWAVMTLASGLPFNLHQPTLGPPNLKGLRAFRSQGVRQVFIPVTTKADMGTVGDKTRPSVPTLLSFLMLFD